MSLYPSAPISENSTLQGGLVQQAETLPNEQQKSWMIPLTIEESDEPEMTFVINLQDSHTQEFYINQASVPINMKDAGNQTPLFIQTGELSTQIARISQQYGANCLVYAIPQPEFWQRRNQMKTRSN